MIVNTQLTKRGIAKHLLLRGYPYSEIIKEVKAIFDTGLSNSTLKELQCEPPMPIGELVYNVNLLLQEIDLKIVLNQKKVFALKQLLK